MENEEKKLNSEETSSSLTEVQESAEDTIKHHTDEDIQNFKNQIQSLQEKILRTMAESENIRKRYEKTVEEARDYAIVSFAKDLLGVIDNLYRALDYKDKAKSNENETVTNIITGVEMTKTILESIFQKHGINSIIPVPGEKFDYNLHQAISQIANTEYDNDCIVNILQTGYKIKDRLLRPAIVTVSKNTK